MSPRLIFLAPHLHSPIPDLRLPNLEYRVSNIEYRISLPNFPISHFTGSLIRSSFVPSNRYDTIITTPLLLWAATPQGGFEPELNLEDPVHLGVEDAERSSRREGIAANPAKGVDLESFPARTLPFSFPGPKYPNPDSRISNIDSRIPNIVPQFNNLPIYQFPNRQNLLREESNLIRIRRAFL
jgi:hypothetical protein